LGVPSATAAPAVALDYHAFTPQRPTYTFSDVKGRLDNQVNYQATRGPRTQWSYRVNRRLAAIAKGPATETATLYCNGRRIPGYRDYHAGVSAGYLFHSSYGPLRTGCLYRLNVTISFKAPGGMARLAVNHGFYITYV
jgi:hypothetical protein